MAAFTAITTRYPGHIFIRHEAKNPKSTGGRVRRKRFIRQFRRRTQPLFKHTTATAGRVLRAVFATAGEQRVKGVAPHGNPTSIDKRELDAA
jgi:hypothetical protein